MDGVVDILLASTVRARADRRKTGGMLELERSEVPRGIVSYVLAVPVVL